MKAETIAELVGSGLAATSVLQVVLAWRRVKASHDIQDAKMCCCEKTLKLFSSLDELERDIVGIVKEK